MDIQDKDEAAGDIISHQFDATPPIAPREPRKRRHRLQKCQRKRKRRLREIELALAQQGDNGEGTVNFPSISSNTLGHEEADINVQKEVPMEIEIEPVNFSQTTVTKSAVPANQGLQPKPKSRRQNVAWVPFSPTLCLYPNIYQASYTSSGRFCPISYLGKVLLEMEQSNPAEVINSNDHSLRPEVKLRNTILTDLPVHHYPSTADSTHPLLIQTLQKLIQGNKLDHLTNIFQKVIKFHRKIRNLSVLVRNYTIRYLPWSKFPPKLKFKTTKKALRYKLSRGSVPYKVVLSVIHDICRQSGALELLTSKRNIRLFMRFLKRLFLAGQKSRLQLKLLLEVLDQSNCDWLRRIYDPILQSHLFAKISLWLLCDYVYSLLKLGYHITTMEGTRCQLHFYLHDCWRSVTLTVKSRFVRDNQLRRILSLRNGVLKPNSTFRLTPKSDDLRPIVSSLPGFLYRDTKVGLSDIQLLLGYLALRIAPHASGTASDFFLRNAFKKFRNELESKGKDKKLFYLRMDLQNAFGSVDMKKLKAILIQAVDKTKVYRTVTLQTKNRAKSKQRIFLVCGDDDLKTYEMHVNFGYWMENTARRGDVFPVHAVLSKLLKLLDSRTIVKIANKFYNFINGLPQGSPFSTSLCLIYYGHMDRHRFGDFLNQENEFFCRCVDDYFFITTDLSRVESLYNRAKPGFPNYGMQIKETKTAGSIFESDLLQGRGRWLVFCGWRFSLEYGHVTRDFTSYSGTDPCCSMTFCMNNVKSIETFIGGKLLFLPALRLGYCVMDSWLNCKWQICTTLFDVALLSAYRFYAACRVLYPSLRCLEDTEKAYALYHVIVMFIRKLYKRVKNLKFRLLEELHCQCGEEFVCDLPKDQLVKQFEYFEVKYLVVKAFVLKLRLHNNQKHKNTKGLLLTMERALNYSERKMDRKPRYLYLRQVVSLGIPDYFKAMIQMR